MKIRLFRVVLAAACMAFAISLVPSLRAGPAEFAQLRAKAEKGNGLAQYNLGLAYAEGRDVPKDLLEAYVWLRLSSENGGTGTALTGVVRQMSIEEIATARLRLDELRRTLATAAKTAPAVSVAAVSERPAAAVPPAPPEDRSAAMQEELSVLRVDNARLTQQLASLQGAQSKQDVSGALADQKKLADLGAQLEAARKELEKEKARKTELEPQRQDLAKLRTENETLTAANHRLEDQERAAADLTRKLTEEQSTIEQLKKENARLQVQHAEVAVRSDAPAPAATSVQAPVGDVDELAKLKEQLGRANSEVQMTLRSYALLREENARLITQLTQTKAP
jgi:DNA repair exonuclease SbcCD ATPase subunit